jgi:hypothetical protein
MVPHGFPYIVWRQILHRGHMERKSLYAYTIAFIALAVLLIIAVSNYYTIASLNEQLGLYKKQQGDLTRLISAPYLKDMDAARRAWVAANQREYIALQNERISIEADTLKTKDFTAVLDLHDPSMTRVDATPSDVAPGEAIVYLGQYYLDNMTRASGWTVSYTVNTTTHAVSGLTSTLIQDAAYGYYASGLAPTIYEKLGVANGTVTGYSQRSIDCSYLPESGNWMDVTEYKYSLKYGGLTPYLLVKTYVNATDVAVVSVDVSKPYYDSVTGLSY